MQNYLETAPPNHHFLHFLQNLHLRQMLLHLRACQINIAQSCCYSAHLSWWQWRGIHICRPHHAAAIGYVCLL